jgi:general secretion pathway protein B
MADAPQAHPAEKAPAAAKAPAAPEQPLAGLRDLPEHIQKEMPAMLINGYIYANRPSDRSMIINNKLMHEGEQVAPGLTLEKMLPREAVMNYRGYRYRVSY